MEEIKDVLTSGDVAKICNVAPKTVSNWIDKGLLKGYKIPGSRDRRVVKNNLLAFMAQNGMPVHVSAKRTAVIFGVDDEYGDILKKLVESEIGVEITICNDQYAAGMAVGSLRPCVIFVDCDSPAAILPMLKSMDLSTAEVVVATNGPTYALAGTQIDVIPKPYRIKDVVAAIATRI